MRGLLESCEAARAMEAELGLHPSGNMLLMVMRRIRLELWDRPSGRIAWNSSQRSTVTAKP